jgi:glycerol kinase
MGAAALAGLAVGFWKSQTELGRARQLDRRFKPKMVAGQREALYAGWREAVGRVRSAR